MFEKRCNNCKNKVSRKFPFCPYCGISQKEKKNEGLLDNIEEEMAAIQNPAFKEIEAITENISKSMGFPLNHIFKKLTNEIGQQLREADKDFLSRKDISKLGEAEKREQGSIPKGISIQIRIGGGMPSHPQMQPGYQNQTPVKNIIASKNLTQKQKEKSSKLPREEPETKVRRLTDKVIYEISIPGVKSIKDIAVIKLDNSIEIKAISKDRAYFKFLPISLPLLKYYLKEGSLFLELKP
ncbi:MAG: hypothetical protein V1660_00815 [archaeon]